MHLYQGTTRQFIADATQARLATMLADRWFEEMRYRPSPSEVTSWRNSLQAMASALQLTDLSTCAAGSLSEVTDDARVLRRWGRLAAGAVVE